MNKKILCLLVGVLFLILGMGLQENVSQAASLKSSYMKVLKKYKKKGFTMFVKYDANCTFNGETPSTEEGFPRLLTAAEIKEGKIRYYDLNGDGKKECILNAGGYFNIFTIAKKKVKYLGGIRQRNGDGICYKRKRTNFIVESYGGRMFQYHVFRIKNGVMKKVCMIGDQVLDDPVHLGEIVHDYYYNDKKTSGKKYKKYFKKYVKGVPGLNVV